ncbi:MAG: NAD-dependent succinate-semialdehyde dehydrogenase [Bacteroidales bacterium]|jgi:succinate-semialdehyde dehydrogenase/glutarate-semialdehyde dehydrogenase|nr:NAD-dependent succinate-semialdehyde dehydrogenase [Bacteroidales bacterium]
MSLKSTNPFTGKLIKEYPSHSDLEIEKLLNNSVDAYQSWKRVSIKERALLMKQAAEILRDNKMKYAEIMSNEMGKCITEAQAEVEKSAWVCDYYAEKASEFMNPKNIKTDYLISKVIYQPIGPILAIMPWNFPLWQVFRFAAPNLMAGNTGILKHASNVSGCSLSIQEVFEKAGFPTGVFQSVLIRGSETSKVIEDKRIAGVTLTGSTEAGKKVAEAAGKSLKKTVLELGGSDPYLILADADISLAAEKCAAGRLLNAGQSCIGAKRFLVHDAIYDEFLSAFKQAMQAVKLGNPMDANTQMGPLANTSFRDDLHYQVEKSIEAGATCILGGEIPDMQAAFYPSTILADVKPGMPAYDDELFGPVASVIRIKNDEEAICIANDTVFGLGAAVFSKNLKKAEKIAEEIESGAVFINDFVKSDPRLPFGGVKESGYGRELSKEGFREFLNIKTIAGKP